MIMSQTAGRMPRKGKECPLFAHRDRLESTLSGHTQTALSDRSLHTPGSYLRVKLMTPQAGI
jgi:hypothetical protein